MAEEQDQNIINDKELSFTGHLKELRVRLIKSLLSVGVGFLICWFFCRMDSGRYKPPH